MPKNKQNFFNHLFKTKREIIHFYSLEIPGKQSAKTRFCFSKGKKKLAPNFGGINFFDTAIAGTIDQTKSNFKLIILYW